MAEVGRHGVPYRFVEAERRVVFADLAIRQKARRRSASRPVSDRGVVSEFKWSSQRLERAAMKRWKRQSDRSGRAALRSPGRPTIANREQMRRFWAAISAGLVSEEAAATAGVPQAVGARWFRKAGGMRPAMFGPSAQPRSGRYKAAGSIWRANRYWRGVKGAARLAVSAERTPILIHIHNPPYPFFPKVKV